MMGAMRHFLAFGNHPELSLAEACSFLPLTADPVRCGSAAIVETADWDGMFAMANLGGTVKLGDVLAEAPTRDVDEEWIREKLDGRLPAGRFAFGFSVIGGTPTEKKHLQRLPIRLKKRLAADGHAARWVTSDKGPELTPAAVHKMKLTTEGLDLVLLVQGGKAALGITTDVQNPDIWSERDFDRPARDARNGMLPPKLARILVNLARVPENGVLLDPFCGGGTVSMEAALGTRAARIIGSDIEDKQVHDAQRNQDWLIQRGLLRTTDIARLQLFRSDVRRIGDHLAAGSVDGVATEGWLGPPLSGHEREDALRKTAGDIAKLWRETLQALHPVLRPDGRIAGIWPGLRSEHGQSTVSLKHELAELGYELETPPRCPTPSPWIYHRPDQWVSRHLFVAKKTA
jgi:tRNA G10  N-methylase Trm11